jgi:hypothetical protein
MTANVGLGFAKMPPDPLHYQQAWWTFANATAISAYQFQYDPAGRADASQLPALDLRAPGAATEGGFDFDFLPGVREIFQTAAQIVEERGPQLIRAFADNVNGVAVSLKYKDRVIVPEPCITFFVNTKLSKNQVPVPVPDSIDGVRTDVVEGGAPVLYTAAAGHIPGQRTRPPEPGTSVSHVRVTSGTFGCLVEDDQHSYILSCAHVLSDVTGTVGDSVVQPGTTYGGTAPADQIARLSKWVPLSTGVCVADAAIAELDEPTQVTANIRGLGKPTGTRTLTKVGLSVQKSGDMTGVTSGIVIGLNGTVGPIVINGHTVFLQNVILTTGMSQPGDSGSLLMDYQKQALGLLFGGLQNGNSFVVSWFTPIDIVLKALSVRLA